MLIVAAAGALFNLFLWTSMFLVQMWESKAGKIQKKSKDFFYMESFHSHGWGDVFGITLMDAGATVVIVHGWNLEMAGSSIVCFLFGLGAAVAYVALCFREGHKPDAGYPEVGKISLQGVVHLMYIAFQVFLGSLGVYIFAFSALKSGAFQEVLGYAILSVVGFLIWAVAVGFDVKQGHFAPLPKEKQKNKVL